VPPEVKVRISVEGTPEALAAFRSVQAQAQVTGRASGKAFAPLSGALSGIKGLLAGAAAAFSVGALASFGKQVLDNVEKMGRLAEELGTTVEHMSGLSLAATLADSDLETVSATMGSLAKNVDALKNKEPAATAAFHRLHLGAKDFPGEDTALWYGVVADRLSKIADGGAKTAGAMALMGKNGRAALPIMKQYVELGGPAGAEAAARAIGVYVDAQTLRDVRALGDSLKLVKMGAAGAALEFSKGFSPALVRTIDALAGSADGAASSFESMGQMLAWLLGLAVPAVNVFDQMAMNLARWGLGVVASMDATRLAALGRFTEARRTLDALKWQREDMDAEVASRIAARNRAIKAPVPDVKSPPGRDRVLDDPKAAAKDAAASAALARQKQAIEDELKLKLDGYKVDEDDAKRAYDGYLMGLDDYFARRRELVEKRLAAEIAALDQQRALADKEKDPAKRGAEQDRIATAASSAALEAEAQLKDIASEESDASDKSLQASLAALKKILEARGEVHKARMLEIAEEAQVERERLTRAGSSPGDVEAGVANFRGQLEARADYEDQLRQAQADLEAVKSLDNITPEDIARLNAVADALGRVAVALGPSAVKDAKDFKREATEVVTTERELTATGRTFAGALGSWLGSSINQVNSLSDAFRSLGLAIMQAVQQMLAMKIAESLFSLIPGMSATKKARGGLIRGPGTSMSDSIFALLSNGEYVVRAFAVAQPGVLAHLEAINRGHGDSPVRHGRPGERPADGRRRTVRRPARRRRQHRALRGPDRAPRRHLPAVVGRPANPDQDHQQEPPGHRLGTEVDHVRDRHCE
jgi:hypothetical protein